MDEATRRIKDAQDRVRAAIADGNMAEVIHGLLHTQVRLIQVAEASGLLEPDALEVVLRRDFAKHVTLALPRASLDVVALMLALIDGLRPSDEPGDRPRDD